MAIQKNVPKPATPGNKKLQEERDVYHELLTKRIPKELERIMMDCDDVETVDDLRWLLNNIEGAIRL
jgi:hypothetical protein